MARTVDAPNAELVIAEAGKKFGTSCYIISEAGKEYGPNPIEWQAHYDFGPGRFWCDAHVPFGGLEPGVYVGYRTITDDGTVRGLAMFYRPISIMTANDSAHVTLHT